jgi:hypothetical protein
MMCEAIHSGIPLLWFPAVKVLRRWTAWGQTGIVETLRTMHSAGGLIASQEERHDTRRISQSCPCLNAGDT